MINSQTIENIERAINAIANGKMIIVVDDENRENEGDFICAAEKVTPEIINFMAREGRGLICASVTETRCEELDLPLIVGKNNALHETAFTVSIDLIHPDVSTGISAKERALTIQALTNPKITADDFARPGHIFPLKAKKEGVLRRAGHTEAATDFAQLAGLQPIGVLVEIMREDGEMARLPDLKKIAKKFQFPLVSIEDLIAYRLHKETLVEKKVSVKLPTQFGEFQLHAYQQKQTQQVHIALTKGNWSSEEPILVRVHSSCVTGDIFHSLRCDCGDQLSAALRKIQAESKGILLYMNQEGRGIGLINKLKAYELQEQGMDTVEANLALGFPMDQRDYGIGAQILRDLGVRKMKLMTNNPKKRVGLVSYNLEITDVIPIEVEYNSFNKKYLETKRDKMGHTILPKNQYLQE